MSKPHLKVKSALDHQEIIIFVQIEMPKPFVINRAADSLQNM